MPNANLLKIISPIEFQISSSFFLKKVSAIQPSQ